MSDAAALGAGVTGKLAELAAHMRAAGTRVGVDELLVAHEALGVALKVREDIDRVREQGVLEGV